jgi:hypothetical protein
MTTQLVLRTHQERQRQAPGAGPAKRIESAPVTSSLPSGGDKPATEEGDAAVAIEFDGWAVAK